MQICYLSDGYRFKMVANFIGFFNSLVANGSPVYAGWEFSALRFQTVTVF